jgi:hypothetical protein
MLPSRLSLRLIITRQKPKYRCVLIQDVRDETRACTCITKVLVLVDFESHDSKRFENVLSEG